MDLFCFVLGLFGFISSFFLLLQALESPERAEEQRKKKNPKDFLELLRVICSKQSIPKVNVLETFRSLSPSSLQFSMSKEHFNFERLLKRSTQFV